MAEKLDKLLERTRRLAERARKEEEQLERTESAFSETISRSETESFPEKPEQRPTGRKPRFNLEGTSVEVMTEKIIRATRHAGSQKAPADFGGDNQNLQDAINAGRLARHYKDPYSMAAAFAQSTIGYGNFDIDLTDEGQREMFKVAQAIAMTQQNQNTYMKKQALMNSYRFRGDPQFLSYEDWDKMRQAREMAQLRLKVEQEIVNNSYMKMGQMEEQLRRDDWFNTNYPKNPKFI